MTHLFKVLGAIIPASLALVALIQVYGDYTSPLIFSSIIFIVLLFFYYVESKLQPELNAEAVICTGLGLFLALGIAFFATKALSFLKSPGIDLAIYALLGYFGAKIGFELYKGPGLAIFGKGNLTRSLSLGNPKEEVRDKILDTSVVIDGRILDIAETHFIDGPLILPNFVLREIQLISDSSDPIKRARGRRGLDMLNKLQRKGSIEVKITYTDYTDIREVDAKLIRLARDTGAKLVTNDFNLNKVAELQGVKVLNLNNLANALKPVVLPGEELEIQVIKEGKDENQGIGYLEDGTMVVIENGGHLVGKEVKATVTSIIQTAAGKMIFTKVSK